MRASSSCFSPWAQSRPTAVLAFSDGHLVRGYGIGARGHCVGEVCFNTAITGYQEILTDPSYLDQLVCFTFPHIGNVGTNDEDMEATPPCVRAAALGCIVRAGITTPSNYRCLTPLQDWLEKRGVIGICGVDTRDLTRRIRQNGFLHAALAHEPDGCFDLEALFERARDWQGLEGLDLAKRASCGQGYTFEASDALEWFSAPETQEKKHHVVVIDYGIKKNILRLLSLYGCRVTVLPATASAGEVKAHKPDGVFLSNGPGDPAATGVYAEPVIRELIDTGVPLFGICLGHQLLARALGGKTIKMHQGHHGANHPVKDLIRGTVEITSMNHGFTVDSQSLPAGVRETHHSLFDGTNAGLSVSDKPIFSVQFHPEASPGPCDGHYMFERFVNLMRAQKGLLPLKERGSRETVVS